MAESFEGLGLREELVHAAREVGYLEPTAIQSAAIPVLRRGGNALVHAAPGAGTMATYGLALLDRLAGETGGVSDESSTTVRALVIVATPDEALQSALSLARLAQSAGLRVISLGGGWALSEDSAAEIVVADPVAVVDAVERSRLKFESMEALVLDGASAIFALDGGGAVETVTALVPRDAQRVIVTAEVTPEVEDYAERYLRRALRIPPAPIETGRPIPEVEPTMRVDYQVVAPWEKEEAVASLLARAEPGRQRVVYARSEVRAAEVGRGLELRGFRVSRGEGERADVVLTTTHFESPADALVISIDPPFDANSLAERHERGGTLVITPRELAHLRQIAEGAGFDMRLTGTTPITASPEIAEYRARLRQAILEEDIAAQLLILDPLFRESSPAEVAAAASALLRRRTPPTLPAPEVQPAETRPDAPLTRPSAARVAPAPSPSYVRLFVGVGARDDIAPSDLVGAITGEAQVRGGQVGRIDIKDTFSIVEVEADVAPRVIKAVNGITLKGRSVRVDFDRRGSAPPARGGPDRSRRRSPGPRRPPRERP